ncbi:malto-oligosyltrehalose synthase [Candidatus Nitronereus thalassa]|uniref:Malto-oligosyltrehalose synthase n=1 Tax=Candidatus Nitronereus thalassa TaxID=3020898 RepID=A0ABU3K5W4_9BACT|nr:malto-oligosyltrehalose synthase [Candidatus Nitronereus thalassa]MDT7041776.1 malto-oligosyltrehalose synthase [Candidatus Nitronereus thalassa]
MNSPRVPISTYRLQLNKHFTFQDAARIMPYLHDLGISDCYTSPYLQSAPGSLHGYDVVDPTRLNSEIGSPDDYQTFVDALSQRGMGHILDIVPNHMKIEGPWNTWWQDVLENGPSSAFADFFDINWFPVKRELVNKVLLPILGDQYGLVLERGEIKLHYQDGLFFFAYYDHHLPIDPRTFAHILNFRMEELTAQHDPTQPDIQELQSIHSAVSNLPDRNNPHPNHTAERSREREVIKRRLTTLMDDSKLVADFLQENLRIFNGTPDNPRSFDPLDALLNAQAYRLASWRVASEEINYRRFFDINELAAIRVEEPEVFQHTHEFIFSLIKSGAVSGLRIDHVDGLYDPRKYLQQWQEWAQTELGLSADDHGRALYIVVEKILGKGETLSDDWPTFGTTGYEFLGLLNNLFIDSSHKRDLDTIYARFAKNNAHFEDLVYQCKKLIMSSSMASELNTLGHQLNILSEKHRQSRDYTLNSLTHALREIIACFPVYRTYVTPDPSEPITDRDRAYIRLAVIQAKRKNPATNSLVFDFIQELLLKNPSGNPYLPWSEVHPFVLKFQQTTSPVTAKGVEDTACYQYNRLVSLNEVGGEPSVVGTPLSAFHERMRERQSHWPASLSATSTHDTKRSEDVRARIHVLSEIPKEWKACVTRWHRINKKKKIHIDGQEVPSRNEEYLLYQTLVGAWPFTQLSSPDYQDFCQRMEQYMRKALKEGKVHSSWINPNDAYEDAVCAFVRHILDPMQSALFLGDFIPFQEKIARYGMYNALTQLTLKITAPGVPDFYQGTEIWDFSLVDPDNRRPVDYAHRQQLLNHLVSEEQHNTEGFFSDMLAHYTDGRIKLYLTRCLLHFRRQYPALFQQGDYQPLETLGEKRHHLCAFQRTWEGHTIMVIVPRFLHQVIPNPEHPALGDTAWGDAIVVLPENSAGRPYRNVLTQETVQTRHIDQHNTLPAASIFHHLPIAMMEQLP